jgi:carboxyl-terminal processing protease
MKKHFPHFLMILAVLTVSHPAFADLNQETPGNPGWKDSLKEDFSNSEENFNLVMKKLMDRYVDKDMTRDELYRAATAGMLEALNQEGKASWNRLISPTELANMKTELAGKVSGIGIVLKYDESQGHGKVLHVITGSVGEKSGIKTDDEILSVNGQKFKGKPFHDLVYAIRGKEGETVKLKILRDDKILSLGIKRETLSWNSVELKEVAPSTALLTLSFFSEDTPARMKEKLAEVNKRGFKNLIIDLRDNGGGGFEQMLAVANMFARKDDVVAKTKDRSGHEETYLAKEDGILDPAIHLTVLVNHGTTCGAELFASVLKEKRKATLVGTPTFGKWNVQTVDLLPNGFGVKYTVANFYSPQGQSFEGKGIKPDLEVPLADQTDVGEMRAQSDFAKRLNQDTQLRAAIELNHSS